MNNIGLFLMLIAIGAIAHHFAKARGRNPRAWFILGFVFGLIGLAMLFILPPLKRKQRLHTASQIPPSLPGPPQIKPPAIKPLDPSQTDKLWYYLDDASQQYGPMSINALSRAWEEGKIKAHHYVWNEHLADWKPFDQVLSPIDSKI